MYEYLNVPIYIKKIQMLPKEIITSCDYSYSQSHEAMQQPRH